MRVLDLFAGTKGFSAGFAARGHEVFSVELDRSFPAISLYADVGALDPSDLPWRPDVVLASPPCTTFSMMSMAHHWTYDGKPKSRAAEEGRRLVLATLALVEILEPLYFVLENPRARLRTLGWLDDFERRTVWQCRYGRPYAKPTDLWGRFPAALRLRPECGNGGRDHVTAPRGSRSGVQGAGAGHGWSSLPDAFGARFGSGSSQREAARRAVAAIPWALSLEIATAAELMGPVSVLEQLSWLPEGGVGC